MGLFDQFPYTNFHELNLDWVLRALKDLEHTIEQFVALNTIKYADPIQWNITTQYEANTVVVDPQTGTAYISTQPVPTGVGITNTDYWSVIFTLDVISANKNITLRDDGSNVLATFASDSGDWLLWNSTLYKVSQAINVNEAYVVGYNLTRYTVEMFISDYVTELKTEIGDLADLDTTDKDNLVEAINEVLQTLTTTTGDLADLDTTDKDNLVEAINEVHNIATSINLGYINVRDYGAKGNGVADDTQAIKDALAAARTLGIKKVYAPSGIYLVSDTISLMDANNQNIHLCGAGFWSTIFRRAAGFTNNFFNTGDDGNGNAYEGMVCFSDFLIENGGNNPFVSCPGSYGIVIQTCGVLDNVFIANGGNGFYCNGARVSFKNCQYFADYVYTQNYQCNRGFHFDGHPYNIMMVNCSAEGQDPNANYPLASGLLITGADGIQIDNCAFTGQIAIDMYANTNNVDDVFFSNCIMDNGKLWNVRMQKAGTAIANNIRFNGCHINNAGTDAVQCVGYDYVQFNSCNFQTAQGSMFALQNNKDITISNCIFDYGDQAGINTTAAVLQDVGGNNGIVINGNVSGPNNSGTYDVILSGSTNVIISNNVLQGNIYGTPAVNANNHTRT